MPTVPFFIVDVFAEEKYHGNQLAVFTDAGGLSGAEMQRFAKEMHFSESTFLLSREPRDGGYDARIFTPEAEVPFAGHPTLGTAFVIQQEILKSRVQAVTLNLPVGPIPVTFTYLMEGPDVLWMRQPAPEFGTTFPHRSLAPVLGLDEAALDTRFPVQEVSTGLPFVIVPLQDLASLKRAKADRDRCLSLLAEARAKALLVFSPEPYRRRNDLSVRVFADYYGIPEDPATGSANGCLAAYLARHRYFGSDRIDVSAEQGHEIGRPSLLYLRANDEAGSIGVSVGGGVKMVAHGTFL